MKEDKKMRIAASDIQDKVMKLLEETNLVPDNKKAFTVPESKLLVIICMEMSKTCFIHQRKQT